MEPEQLVSDFRAELPWHLRCSQKTAQVSADNVRLFLAAQSEPFPSCLDYPHVLAWLQHLRDTPPRHRAKERREASTVNNHLKSLKRFAKWAVARGFLEHDPIAHVKGLTEQDRVIMAPTPEVVGSVLKAASDHGESEETKARNYAIVCALIDIGPRAKELVSMDVLDVIDAGGKVREWCVIHGKGGRDRVVAINPLLRDGLERYLPLRRASQGERGLWISTRGRRMTYEALRSLMQRICEKTDASVNLHDFRRYALTQMWVGGIDQVDGMALSGHSTQAIYMRYIRGAIQQRALAKHREHSPLAEVLAGD